MGLDLHSWRVLLSGVRTGSTYSVFTTPHYHDSMSRVSSRPYSDYLCCQHISLPPTQICINCSERRLTTPGLNISPHRPLCPHVLRAMTPTPVVPDHLSLYSPLLLFQTNEQGRRLEKVKQPKNNLGRHVCWKCTSRRFGIRRDDPAWLERGPPGGQIPTRSSWCIESRHLTSSDACEQVRLYRHIKLKYRVIACRDPTSFLWSFTSYSSYNACSSSGLIIL